MNYKIKWIFNSFVFPIISFLPIIIYMLIQSTLNNSILPPTMGYTFWIFIIYFPIYFGILTMNYFEVNGFKRIRYNAYIIVIAFAFLLTFFTFAINITITYFGSPTSDNPSLGVMILLLIIETLLGISIYNGFWRVITNYLAFKGPINNWIHKLAYENVLLNSFKNWTFVVDTFLKVEDNYYENYSILFTRKGIYIVDYFDNESKLKLNFEYETTHLENKDLEFNSILIAENFEFSKIEQRETEDIFSNIIIENNIIDKKVEFALPTNEKIKVVKKIDNSDFIKNILNRRRILKNMFHQNLAALGLSNEEIDEIPIINVIVLEEKSETKGYNEDFLITTYRDFYPKVKELDKLLPNAIGLNRIKKLFFKKWK